MKYLQAIGFVFLFWVVVTSNIQRFKCPSLSETELFLLLADSAALDWKECK